MRNHCSTLALAAALFSASCLASPQSPTPDATPPGFIGQESTPTAPIPIQDSPTPAYTPFVTAPPSQDAALAEQGYTLVTYYTCITLKGSGPEGQGARESCGWHVPVAKLAEGEATGKDEDVGNAVVLAVVLGAVVVAVAMV